MPDDANRSPLEFQALLDVFEKDCGRPAGTIAEVRFWASAQNREHLEFRVKRRLLELLFGPSPDVQQRTGSRFRPPPRGWRVLRRRSKYGSYAIGSVIISVSGLCRRLFVRNLARQQLSHRANDPDKRIVG